MSLLSLCEKYGDNLTHWPFRREPTSGKTGLELLLQFIAKLLDPSQSESAALFVGDLISKLIKKGGDLISPILPELLNAVTIRLVDAKLPSFIQVKSSENGLIRLEMIIPHVSSRTNMIVLFL